MRYGALQRLLPRPLHRHVLHFEASIEDAVAAFAASVSPEARVLDAGSGEGRHSDAFPGRRYFGVDLAVGDAAWDYSHLDCVADLTALPFGAGVFQACLNVVTLEHVRDPQLALKEIGRVLEPGGRLLLVVPQDWEVHQPPHDFYRYTRHGIEHLMETAGLRATRIQPVGGYFRLLARRLLNGVQFFPPWLVPLALLVAAPPALLLPFLDVLDRDRNFTLGYVCEAQKP